MRERKADEAIPQSVQLSREVSGKANYAIDLNFSTGVKSGEASDGIWIEVTLNQIYCVDYVTEYNTDGSDQFRWDCSKDDCSDCKFQDPNRNTEACKNIPLTVTTTDTSLELPQRADCKNGDKVKIQRVSGNSDTVTVAEVAIFGKKGNSEFQFTMTERSVNGEHLTIASRDKFRKIIFGGPIKIKKIDETI